MHFSLPANHTDKNSTVWRKKWETPTSKLRRRLLKAELRSGVLDGSIPSAASDTGATASAMKPSDPTIPTGMQSNTSFGGAFGDIAKATTINKLRLKLREPANSVHIVPKVRDSLLSTSKMVDADYIAVYDKEEVNFYDAKTTKVVITEEAVLTGFRCPKIGLWRVPLIEKPTNLNTDTLILDHPTKLASLNNLYEVITTTATRERVSQLMGQATPVPCQREHINNVYELPSIEQAVRYLHAAAGHPTKHTWLKAIARGNYNSWPLINVRNVRKHFPESEETQLGHMRGARQNVRSTRPSGFEKLGEDSEPPSIAAIEKKGDIYIKVYELGQEGRLSNTMFSDQTGEFPFISSRGNKFIMLVHHVDSNSTWVEPLKNQLEGTLIAARTKILERMRLQGIVPKHQILDNQCSARMKLAMDSTVLLDGSISKMTYELVPPDEHRRNIAEKAIQTFKDHFIGVLSGCAKTMPMHLWCQLLPQVERQLLLLRQSRVNPGMSAYAHVYQGQHDYNKHPFVPIGMEAMVHEKPHKRRTFAQHCKKGYVLGTSFEHYRCQTIWMVDSHNRRTSGAVWFKHKYLTHPSVTPADRITAAIGGLAKTLTTGVPPQLRDETLDKLKRLQDILTPATVEDIKGAPKASAPPPRVHIHPRMHEIVASPRVPARPSRDETMHVVPRLRQWDNWRPEEQPKEKEVQLPRRSSRIAARNEKITVDVGTLQRPSDNAIRDKIKEAQVPKEKRRERPTKISPEAPRRSARIEEMMSKKGAGIEKINALRNVEVRTLEHELVLACIETYEEVTERQVSPRQLSQRTFPKEVLNAVLNRDTGELMEMRHLLRNPKYSELWGKSYTKELGRLAQGIPGMKGTDTIVFIKYEDIPLDRRRHVTYGKTVVSYRPEKDDPNRTRLTVGGNRIMYPGDVSTPTVEMMTVKMHLNSVISTKGARYCTIDIKDFYLNTPMERPEFMRMKITELPPEFVALYKLNDIADQNGTVYMRIQKGMYGLPQAGILAQKLLEERLNAHGYRQSQITPGLWKHDTRPISFTLCVDDFGVKYVGRQHADHLKNVLNEHYKCAVDWDGKKYLGMDIDWDYDYHKVHVSMLDYIPEALARFQHKTPRKPQHQPYPHTKPTYGATKQYVEDSDESEPTSKEEKTYIQEVIGTLLYYARCVDASMLPALGSLATQQANPTQNTMMKVKQLLDYAATHPDAIVTYNASDMVLAAHSDASYLSESNARSRAGGHFFMSSDSETPPNNGAVMTISQIIKAVLSSAAEAEVGALFINCREAVPARHVLEFLGHKQPPTPMQTDNTTALGVVNQNVMKKLKAMDMKYHWLRCRISQEQFRHYWKDGKSNNADYVTKHHPGIHHQATRPTFFTDISKLVELRRRQKGYAMTTLTKPPRSKGVLDVSGRPNTRDYGKALEALKLLTENVLRGPHNRVMGTTCL